MHQDKKQQERGYVKTLNNMNISFLTKTSTKRHSSNTFNPILIKVHHKKASQASKSEERGEGGGGKGRNKQIST